MGKKGIIVKLLIIMWYHSQQFPHMRKKNNAHGPASGLQEKNYSFHSNGEGDTPQNNAEIVFVLLPLQSYLDVLLFDQVCVWVTYFLQTIRCCLIWISIEIKELIPMLLLSYILKCCIWMTYFILCSMSDDEFRFVRWILTQVCLLHPIIESGL